MTRLLSYLALLVWALLALPTHAIPTIHGPTGLIAVPTAESLKYKEFNLALDYQIDPDDSYSYFYKANLGTFKGWELGVVGGRVPSEGVYLNAKYYLMSDNSRFPVSIAIGMENLASSTRTGLYMVASKRFRGGLYSHLGFKAAFASTEMDLSIMGGLEYFMSDQLSLLADISGAEKVYVLNAGARFILMPDVVLRGSILDVTSNRERPIYTFGLSFAKFL